MTVLTNAVGSSWKRLTDHLGPPCDHPLSVLADGAKWIWREAAKRFDKDTRWIVDLFHVSEHLHTCAKDVWTTACNGTHSGRIVRREFQN